MRWPSQFSCYLNRLFNNTTHCIILIGHSLIEAMNNIKLNIETQDVHLEEVRFSEEEILLLKAEELLWLKWGNSLQGHFLWNYREYKRRFEIGLRLIIASTNQFSCFSIIIAT